MRALLVVAALAFLAGGGPARARQTGGTSTSTVASITA